MVYRLRVADVSFSPAEGEVLFLFRDASAAFRLSRHPGRSPHSGEVALSGAVRGPGGDMVACGQVRVLAQKGDDVWLVEDLAQPLDSRECA